MNPAVRMGLLCLLAIVTPQLAVGGEIQPSQPAVASGLEDFDAAMQRYVAMRSRIQRELPALTVTDNPSDIVAKSDALARAIERGRAKSERGEFFSARVAQVLRLRLASAAGPATLDSILAPIAEERSTIAAMRVHARFPVGAPLSTMPTALLDVLPVLAEGLEFRFVGATLVLRDVDAGLIIDFMPRALPSR